MIIEELDLVENLTVEQQSDTVSIEDKTIHISVYGSINAVKQETKGESLQEDDPLLVNETATSDYLLKHDKS